MKIRVLDLETTGFEQDCDVIEVAAYDVIDGPNEVWNIEEFRSSLIQTNRPIPPSASAAHHIVAEDLRGMLPWEAVWPGFIHDGEPDMFCAHNANFEKQFLTPVMTGDKKWICTWKCAMYHWPEAPGFSNQELRYWLKPFGLDRKIANVAHRAGPDAYVTAFTLRLMLFAGRTPAELVEISSRPALLPTVTFGKHRGLKWSEVPRDYLHWVINKSDMDENTIYTAREHFSGRASYQGAEYK